MTLAIHQLDIPFKQAFAHATAIRSCTESVVVKSQFSQGIIGVGEGCPRQYVTGESVQSAERFFSVHRETWEQFNNFEALQIWMGKNGSVIDANPACWCAVELAFLDCWAQEAKQSIEAFLNLQELTQSFQYTAVLGTENLKTFEKQAQQFAALNFCDFKVKVTGNLENDRQNISFLRHLPIKSLRIRLDANNLWKTVEEAVSYLKDLDGPFFAIEEPLQVGNYEGCRQISQQLQVPIILDESFLRNEQLVYVEADPKTWIINVRISKMGGILRSLDIAEQAKKLGIPIIIGAQVGETSILTRAALTVANSYRDILLAQEGAFGTYLLDHDITETPLMFGKGGSLDPHHLTGQPGLGLKTTQI